MEKGTIKVAISWGVGQIQPDEDAELIVFTMRVFNEDWSQAFAGRRVDFERYVNSADAKKVIGR